MKLAPIEIVPIDDAVTSLLCRKHVWAYVIKSPAGLAIFDTGYAGDEDELFPALESLGSLAALGIIIASHGHGDHFGGIAALVERTKAEVYAHPLDAPLIRGEQQPPAPDLTDFEKPIYDSIMRGLDGSSGPRFAKVDHEVVDRDVIDIGEPAVVIHVPGHTPGSIALHLPARRMVLTGDMAAGVSGEPVVGFFNADRGAAVAAFQRLATLDFDIACFGHGTPLLKDAASAFRREAEKLTG